MSDREMEGLRAKIACANKYLEQVLQHRKKIDSYDIMKVVTPSMRPYVEIVSVAEAQMDGTGIVRLRGVA